MPPQSHDPAQEAVSRKLMTRLADPDLDQQLAALEDLGDYLEYADWRSSPANRLHCA